MCHGSEGVCGREITTAVAVKDRSRYYDRACGGRAHAAGSCGYRSVRAHACVRSNACRHTCIADGRTDMLGWLRRHCCLRHVRTHARTLSLTAVCGPVACAGGGWVARAVRRGCERASGCIDMWSVNSHCHTRYDGLGLLNLCHWGCHNC